MAQPRLRFSDVLPLVLFAMICFQVVTEFVFARYIHYHSQNRVLDPAHYTAKVEPVAAALAEHDPASRSRASMEGGYVVEVKTLGTAHELDRLTTNLLPFLGLGIAGVAAQLYAIRRRPDQPDWQDTP